MDELEFLDIIESPLIDGGDFFQLLLRFGFNFLVTGIIIHLFYYPKEQTERLSLHLHINKYQYFLDDISVG
ncbi:hypothetical protein [Bacteroides thetaiotaomicron]|uniref:hypothetical protein n=1 Tax=Bacteroides thetaiotaomicron TaxID=818 RepID=UPI0021669364|nr:hypothetical protein [Bacteroides thetaiotaomicron]MCS2207872.1 hypothetical protein [Bacteroides thetaiotaomicron]